MFELTIAYMQGAEKQKKKDANQLNKAKEIIKDFISLGVFRIFKGTTAEEIIVKAEQFLNSEVEK